MATLFPGYFALVMATGIISIGCYLVGLIWLAWLLLAVNLVAYVVLWLLLVARLAWFFPRAVADLTDPARGPGYFTIVAGTCVLSRQVLLIGENPSLALFLWIVGLILGLALNYTFLLAAAVRAPKPSPEHVIHGGLLLVVVGTQSVSLSGTRLAAYVAIPHEIVLGFTLATFLAGCMVYLVIITLVVYRLLIFPLPPQSFTPSYWITMGAAAITALAGATLIRSAPQWSFLQDLIPFLKGITFFFWAIATWWLPLLLVVSAWRHAYHRVPLAYEPQYWALVFPLGMYAVCTLEVGGSMHLAFLSMLPRYVLAVALVAWVSVFAGMVRTLARSIQK